MKERIWIICKNIGCRLVFGCPMQLERHAKKSTKPVSETSKNYILKDGVYVCCIRNKSPAHQSNIIRNTKACNDTSSKEKTVFSCDKFNKYFDFCMCISKVIYANVKIITRDSEEKIYLNNINWVVLILTMIFLNWDLLHARLSTRYEAWN